MTPFLAIAFAAIEWLLRAVEFVSKYWLPIVTFASAILSIVFAGWFERVLIVLAILTAFLQGMRFAHYNGLPSYLA